MNKFELSEYKTERKKLMELEREYSELKSSFGYIKSIEISDMPKSKGISKSVENAAIMYEDLREKIALQQEKTLTRLTKLENIVQHEILTSREQLLLRLHYIRGLVWVEVCAEMELGWTHTHRIHAEILIKIKDL